MGIIGKSFAFVIIPLGLLLMAENFGFFSLNLSIPLPLPFPFALTPVILAAGLLLILEIISIVMVVIHFGRPSVMNIVTAVFSVAIAAAAVLAVKFDYLPKEASIALGVVLVFVGVKAMH
ncbi:hypothetical protein HYU14_04930 [Candidatus Woesearchaeota archaeon]|nr:hypothetical protein [Candidatus Woesearchaeota archaeon]